MFPTSRLFRSSRRTVDAATQRMFLVAIALLAVSVGVWAVSLSGDSLLAGQFTNNAFRSCVDSDETNNFKSFTDASASLFTAGAAKVAFKDKSETKLVDFCITETTLNEYGCFGTVPGSVAVQCENGCSEGACVAGKPTPQPKHFLTITNVTNDSGKIRLQYQTFGGGTAIDVLLWKVSATAPGPDTFVQIPCGYSSRACSGTPATCNLRTNCAYPTATDFSSFRYAVNVTVRGRPALTDIKEIYSGGITPTPAPTPFTPTLIISRVYNDSGNIAVDYKIAGLANKDVTILFNTNSPSSAVNIVSCSYQSVTCGVSFVEPPYTSCTIRTDNCSYPSYNVYLGGSRFALKVSSLISPTINNVTEIVPPAPPQPAPQPSITISSQSATVSPQSNATLNVTIMNFGNAPYVANNFAVSCNLTSLTTVINRKQFTFTNSTFVVYERSSKTVGCGGISSFPPDTYNFTFSILPDGPKNSTTVTVS